MAKKQDQTRYEIKIVLDQSLRHHVSQWIRLHSSGFTPAKQKINRLGWKDTQPINGSFDLHTMTWNEITTLIKESSREGFSQMIEESNPVLINHYQREYYKAAFDDEIRVSVDTKLTTYLQGNNYKPNLQFALPPGRITILEVKCPLAKSDQIPELLGEIPARPGAFSKYNQAMEYNYLL